MSNYATHGKDATWAYFAQGGLSNGRAGLGFDSTITNGETNALGNPIIIDTAGNVSLKATPTSLVLAVGGTTIATLGSNVKLAMSTKLAVAGGASSSGVFASLANPFGADVLITRAILVTTVIATAAATVDIGVAADATTSNDGLIDGLDVNAATGVFDSAVAAIAGTNGKPSKRWSTTQFLNVAEASGNVDGLVGTLYIEAILQ